MNVETWKTATKEYIENTLRIRKLSSTTLEPGYTEQGYYEELSNHFIEIREIAARNKAILDESLYPCLTQSDLLFDELIDAMNEFVDQMINGYDLLSVDTILVIEVVERLLKDAYEKQDTAYIIRQLDIALIVYYTAFNMLNRTKDFESLRNVYRDRGIDLENQILHYIEKDQFIHLDDDCKERVLINSRYAVCFYETKVRNPKNTTLGIKRLLWAKSIMDDPFYHEFAPSYDWFYHKIRLCEYACTMTQAGNIKGLTNEQCQIIYPYALELDESITEDIDGLITLNMARILSARVKYYAKKISQQEYLDIMHQLYAQRKQDSYHIDDVYMNLILPTEYLVEMQKKKQLTEENYRVIDGLYHDIIRYISRTKNDETLGASLEYYADFLNFFIEYPGGLKFSDIIMFSMAGMHLPTYVHSNMVGSIALCIAGHMLKKNPEYFLGFRDLNSKEEILAHKSEILDFIYQAGLYHDAGKLFMIDIVFVYGRKLLNTEFDIIRLHPTVGKTLLEKYPSTQAYATLAEAHHKTADNGGYPNTVNIHTLPERCISSIITVADGMDAATDSVGRSYGKGITLEQFIEEVKLGRGTRYDADVCDLLAKDKSLFRDLSVILQRERQGLYYKSYDLLFKNF